MAGEILDRFKAFGIDCYDTDTWDLESLYAVMGDAVNHCRSERKPAVVRVRTDRLMAHSKGDDDRPQELAAQFWERDLLSRFQREDPVLYAEYENTAAKRIDAAVASAGIAIYKLPPLLTTI